MTIDPSQPIPLYFQLKTLLLEEIIERRYDSESRLPTEHELCERFKISRTPVSRALSELAEEGVILRHRRRGTFVNPHWLRPRPDQAELRVVVPEGPWGRMLRDATAGLTHLSLVTVPRPSLRQVLTHSVAEGQAPDLAVIDSVWIPEFAAAGFLRPIEGVDHEWVRREHETDFLPALIAANRYRGQTFGVSAFADVAGLWCRRRDLERLGLAPPRTWNELRTVARKLAAGGRKLPIAMPGGSQGGETTAYCLTAFLASNEGAVFDRDSVTLDSPRTVQALRFLRSLVDDSLMPAEVVAYEWNRSTAMLAEGRVSISFGGSYEAAGLAETLGVPLLELSNHVAFVPVPAGPRGRATCAAGTMTYGIFSQASQPRAALALLKQAVAPEALAGIARATGRIPARRSAVRAAEPDFPFVSETARMLERAVIRPATPAYPRVSAQLQAMLEAVLTRRLSPAAAARHTSELVAAITGLEQAGAEEAAGPASPALALRGARR
jgi:multiple sugar transport system substrate-binding protein